MTLLAAENLEYVDASGPLRALWLLLALPAAGAAIVLLLGNRAKSWGPYLNTALTGSAFVYGLIAFFAAVAASGLWNQKAMSRYDARPTPSQPT